MKRLMAILILAIITLMVLGCSKSMNILSSFDETTTQVLIYYINGTPYIDEDGDGSPETPLTELEFEALKLQVMANGGSIKVMP